MEYVTADEAQTDRRFPNIHPEGLRLVTEEKLAIGAFTEPEPLQITPLHNLSWIPELFRERASVAIQEYKIFPPDPYFFPIRKGDVILNLTSGETITAGEKTKKPIYKQSQVQGGELILIRNGETNWGVKWHEGGQEKTKFGHYTGRFQLDLGDFFKRADSIIGEFVSSVEVGSHKQNTETLAKTLKKQSLVAISTKDGQLVLPKVDCLGQMIIIDPQKLADFIFKNKIYTKAEETRSFGIPHLAWIIVHGSFEKAISTYNYQDIFDDPKKGSVKPSIEELILREIDINIDSIGIKRETDKINLYEWEEFWPSQFRGKEQTWESSQKAVEEIAPQLAKLGFFHSSPDRILAINPDLRSSFNIRVSPRIRISGFDCLVGSLEETAEDVQRLVENTGFQQFKETFGGDKASKAWLQALFNETSNPKSILNQKYITNYVTEKYPQIRDYWEKLKEQWKTNSNSRSSFCLS